MNATLKPIRVSLKKWEVPKEGSLYLLFEKVPLYLTRRDFTKRTDPVSVFTDFGYVELILKRKEIGLHKEWLNDYLGREDLFIEEEENDLTFWDGEEENRYDWSSGYSIGFDEKEVQFLPLSEEEWKSKYLERTLAWDELYYERRDIQLVKFLTSFTNITNHLIDRTMRESTDAALPVYRQALKTKLANMLAQYQKMEEENEAFKLENPPPKKDHSAETAQSKLNSSVAKFWKYLKDQWS
ncbi:MAG: hypothetical protein AB8G15_01955 [Saprospiraceae bacterium]